MGTFNKLDCVILDEYHYGAWRENAKELSSEDRKEVEFAEGEGSRTSTRHHAITTDHYLYLSGTPSSNRVSEFIEEQIFNWTYSDEQRAKQDGKARTIPTPRSRACALNLPIAGRNPESPASEFNESI